MDSIYCLPLYFFRNPIVHHWIEAIADMDQPDLQNTYHVYNSVIDF